MDSQNSTAPSTDGARALGLVHPVDLAVTAIILTGVARARVQEDGIRLAHGVCPPRDTVLVSQNQVTSLL